VKKFDYQFIDGVDFKRHMKTESPLSSSLEEIRTQKTAMGVILNRAMELTGSENEAFQRGVDFYEDLLGPIVKNMSAAFDDKKTREEIFRRLREDPKYRTKE
jgi:hypothetical protein